MIDLITTEAAVAFLQVVMIDLVLAGDNAIVIGLAAAGLPPEQRTRAILIGIVAATVLRIAFAGVTTQLLQIVGLLFAGGILLLWVCWKMWRELRAASGDEHNAAEAIAGARVANGRIAISARRSGASAPVEIAVADNGPGIDADIAARLFHPLTTSKVDGLGLGLSISASIVEAHGGRIWLEKGAAGATEFRFSLPVQAG
jgi:YjbE family integral membrane protein